MPPFIKRSGPQNVGANISPVIIDQEQDKYCDARRHITQDSKKKKIQIITTTDVSLIR